MIRAALAAALLLAACNRADGVVAEAYGLTRVRDCKGPAMSLDPTLASARPSGTGRKYSQEHFADIAARLPGGFAGFYQHGKRFIILLTRIDEAKAAKAAIAPELPGWAIGRAKPRRARWDFAQLLDWYNYLMPRAWAAGVVSGGISQQSNRIRFGVLADSTRQRVVRELTALNIPCDLVLIEIHGPVIRAVAATPVDSVP